MAVRLSLVLLLVVAALGAVSKGPVWAQSQPPRALVLEPFRDQLDPAAFDPSPGDYEVNALRAAGFQVDVITDSNVNITALTSLSRYNVVYMHTHSNTYAHDGVVATGQPANDDAALAPMLADGSVIKVHVSIGNGQQSQESYYAITSTFVSKYLGTFPSHSLLFVNGCDILPATNFWQALQSKGLGALVSWNGEAAAFDNLLGAAAFFVEMRNGMALSAAIQAEQAAGYGKSSSQGSAATMGYLGDGTITLQQAASGTPASPPTATPAAPVSTPTPAPPPTPTPTSTPTATPLPIVPLPLSATLKNAVAPGTRQTISIHSSPNTTVHVHVVFPSGDSRYETLTTDGAGNAQYVYPQHPNRVTYNNVYATVTITAQRGQAVSTLVERYRIMWSAIDVSILPRTQAVGRRVNVWVHTTPYTSVHLSLHFPQGTVLRVLTRTGRHGLADVHYRIGRYLKKGANHTVVVRAKARLASVLHVTETTFTIQ